MLPTFADQAGPGFFFDRYSIGLWWWEINEFPERFSRSFEPLDEVWVGSHFVADAISAVSPVPVVKVTMPVSMPEIEEFDRGDLGLPEGFVFLFVFDYHSVFERKNPLALVEAFEQAFPEGSGASLVLKSINSEHHPEEHGRLIEAARDHRDIHVVDRYVTAAEKNAMFAGCDCYVSLHRSEGFGNTLAEAMYLGKPVIATGYSGNMEFMTPQNSYPVDYHAKTRRRRRRTLPGHRRVGRARRRACRTSDAPRLREPAGGRRAWPKGVRKTSTVTTPPRSQDGRWRPASAVSGRGGAQDPKRVGHMCTPWRGSTRTRLPTA